MDLRELYQEVILDHGKNPRNHAFPDPHNREGKGYNPLCGDRITLKLQVDGDVITDIGFIGDGCAISQASTSTMTEALKGKTLADAEELFKNFHAMLTGADDLEPDYDLLDKLAVFEGVAEFPMRVKCATLGWHTLQRAVANDGHNASTE